MVVGGPTGQQVYTLENADRPYRILVEQMQEGAATLGKDGTILYCNQRFAAIVRMPHENVIGNSIVRFMCERIWNAVHASVAAADPDAGSVRNSPFTPLTARRCRSTSSLVDLMVGDDMDGVCVRRGHRPDASIAERSDELAAANARLAQEIEERGRIEDSLIVALEAAGMGSWDLDLASKTMWRSLRHDQIFGYPQFQPRWTPATSHWDDSWPRTAKIVTRRAFRSWRKRTARSNSNARIVRDP